MARQSTLTIDLGGEQIQLQRVEAVESLSRPFTINIDLFSQHAEVDLLPHLGKPAVIKATGDDDTATRYFHGLVTEGEFMSEQISGFQYRLVLRPFTHFMSQNRNYWIYQDKSAVDIIKDIFKKNGVTAQTDFKLSGSYASRVYCVQYGESDFTFISRLMEEEGIYYFFAHEAGGHKLVLCDAPQAHAAGKAPTLVYSPQTASMANTDSKVRDSAADRVQRWHERVATGGEMHATMRDFDFEKPQTPLEAKSDLAGDHPNDSREVYSWPGPWAETGQGTQRAKVMLEARRADRRQYSGEAQLLSLEVGTKVTLTSHPNARFNRGYLVTRTHHVLTPEIYRSGAEAGGDVVHFEAIPDDAPYRSPQITPRPVVRGPETAIVTGPKGETIYTDKYGRVKVRFHWDRVDPDHPEPEKSTCWIRVSQTGGLGNIILPRVGHEVVVDFLNGDPDRPLVMGRVFNAENMPIYELPANKTRALWRTKSYKSAGGSDDVGAAKKLDTEKPDTANELRFEDKIGAEEVFLHAQRDLNTRIRRNETHFIGLDQDIQIHGARKGAIDETDTLDVKKDIKVTSGTTIMVEAQTSITFKVGKSTIVMNQQGITVNCIMLKQEASATADVKSPMTTVKGDAMLTLKGGMTMIN
ncbi:MAG: type VI secretion system tip protein VgrG [Sphingomonadales bacterium]|nr:MAG: type VI secretion system tip protein VgrG [Sphingomonadales bacterium]